MGLEEILFISEVLVLMKRKKQRYSLKMYFFVMFCIDLENHFESALTMHGIEE